MERRPPCPRLSSGEKSTAQRPRPTRGEPILIDGRVIGFLDGATFTKRLKRSLHYHRKLESWAHDASNLEELNRRGVRTFQILDLESGCLFSTSMETFLEKGTLHDFSYGPQLFLAEKYWQVSDPRQTSLFAPMAVAGAGC